MRRLQPDVESSISAAISGTPDQMLYKTERYNYPGNLTYQFSVPNGNYTVTLKFAEIDDTAAGQRYMIGTLNGATVFTGLDVWTAAGGPNRAYDRSFPVSVTNGQLTITLTCTSSNNSAEVNAIQIVAGTAPQQYYLTTGVSPSAGGTISPACPGGCLYNSGSQVTLTATPASGYQFNGFTGSVSTGSNPLTVTMNSAMGETANFTPIGTQYQLTTSVSPAGGGSISPSCPGGCSYSSGSPVTITATPANGYQFNGFTGSVNSGSNPLTATMNSAKTETANFTPTGTQYTISGQVTITPSFAGAGSAGSGFPLLAMTYSGSLNGTTTTDGNGNYLLIAPAAGNYTLTPQNAAYSYSPSTINIQNLSAPTSTPLVAYPAGCHLKISNALPTANRTGDNEVTGSGWGQPVDAIEGSWSFTNTVSLLFTPPGGTEQVITSNQTTINWNANTPFGIGSRVNVNGTSALEPQGAGSQDKNGFHRHMRGPDNLSRS